MSNKRKNTPESRVMSFVMSFFLLGGVLYAFSIGVPFLQEHPPLLLSAGVTIGLFLFALGGVFAFYVIQDELRKLKRGE